MGGKEWNYHEVLNVITFETRQTCTDEIKDTCIYIWSGGKIHLSNEKKMLEEKAHLRGKNEEASFT